MEAGLAAKLSPIQWHNDEMILIFELFTLESISSDVLMYMDPGTGGILLQVILGGAAGSLVVVRLLWGRLVSGAMRIRGRKSSEADIQNPGE